MKTKLGIKLKSLFDLSSMDYTEIWDTCCDHGQLGLAFLETSQSVVYFVDQVESIAQKLKLKLEGIPEIEKKSYEVFCQRAETIKLGKGRALVCIAGVGGDVMLQIIKELKEHNDLKNCDFLLAPQYQVFEVRSFLKKNGLKSVNEKLVFEGKWGRELMLVSQSGLREIEEVGKNLFDTKNQQHVDYLNGIISHLEKKNNLEVSRKYKSVLS